MNHSNLLFLSDHNHPEASYQLRVFAILGTKCTSLPRDGTPDPRRPLQHGPQNQVGPQHHDDLLRTINFTGMFPQQEQWKSLRELHRNFE